MLGWKKEKFTGAESTDEKPCVPQPGGLASCGNGPRHWNPRDAQTESRAQLSGAEPQCS